MNKSIFSGIEESTENKLLLIETLKQETRSTVEEACDLENREKSSKLTAVLWHFRTTKVLTQGS